MAESNGGSRCVEPPQSGPSQQEKGKAAVRSVSFAKHVDEKEDENDDDEDRGTDSGDDYVSHGLYSEIIAEGFDKRLFNRDVRKNILPKLGNDARQASRWPPKVPAICHRPPQRVP